MKHVLSTCLLVLVACGHQAHENLFVVHNNYVGPIVLILVEDAPDSFDDVDGRHVYNIPRSGFLCVPSFKNFTQGWGTTNAVYANNARIPSAITGSFDDIRFDTLMQKGSVSKTDAAGNTEQLSDPEILFFIGNSKAMEAYQTTWQTETPSFKRHLCKDPPGQ